MDFTLSKEHLLFRQMVREFVENEIKPVMQEMDETEEFPREIWEKLGPAGLLGIQYPKKYGGQGGDYLAYVIAIEENIVHLLHQVLLHIHHLQHGLFTSLVLKSRK